MYLIWTILLSLLFLFTVPASLICKCHCHVSQLRRGGGEIESAIVRQRESANMDCASNETQSNETRSNEIAKLVTSEPGETRSSIARILRCYPRRDYKVLSKLSHIDCGIEYQPRDSVAKLDVHFGQEKLGSNEIHFLTKFSRPDENLTVVYAGAAPGRKTGLIYNLFAESHLARENPNRRVRFLLVDPNPFEIQGARGSVLVEANPGGKPRCSLSREEAFDAVSKAMSGPSGIYIINWLFTNEIAEALDTHAPAGFLFLSDIRTNTTQGELPDTVDIFWNNAQQYNWIRRMNAQGKMRKAMLKFRHPFYIEPREALLSCAEREPYETDFNLAREGGLDLVQCFRNGRMTYFSGEIYLQPYAGPNSTETRLVTDGLSLKDWGTHSDYENRFFAYNSCLRGLVHRENPGAEEGIGFDHCNDCALHNRIWQKYLLKYRPGNTEPVGKFVERLFLNSGRTLAVRSHGKLFQSVSPEYARMVARQHKADLQKKKIRYQVRK